MFYNSNQQNTESALVVIVGSKLDEIVQSIRDAINEESRSFAVTVLTTSLGSM